MTFISSTRSLLKRSTSAVPKAAPRFWWQCRLPTAEKGRAQGACATPPARATRSTGSASCTPCCVLEPRLAARCSGTIQLEVVARWVGNPSIGTAEGSLRRGSPLLGLGLGLGRVNPLTLKPARTPAVPFSPSWSSGLAPEAQGRLSSASPIGPLLAPSGRTASSTPSAAHSRRWPTATALFAIG